MGRNSAILNSRINHDVRNQQLNPLPGKFSILYFCDDSSVFSENMPLPRRASQHQVLNTHARSRQHDSSVLWADIDPQPAAGRVAESDPLPCRSSRFPSAEAMRTSYDKQGQIARMRPSSRCTWIPDFHWTMRSRSPVAMPARETEKSPSVLRIDSLSRWTKDLRIIHPSRHSVAEDLHPKIRQIHRSVSFPIRFYPCSSVFIRADNVFRFSASDSRRSPNPREPSIERHAPID